MKPSNSILSLLFSAVLALLLAGCGGGGGSAPPATGGGGGGGTTPTTVSGKVTLSSTVIGKPALYLKGGTSNELNKVLSAAGVRQAGGLTGATVELYDADHPEWLYPVADTTTGSDPLLASDEYKLSKLKNAANNNGATYTNGADIPAGNYTLIAYKYDISLGKLFVAVQSIVNKWAGPVTGNNLTTADSTAVPSVVSMFGMSKNTDGTFGGTTTNLPANAAIQVTFSMAMARLSVLDAISIKNGATAVAGTWKISADLMSAMFVPASPLTSGTTYTVTIGGGTAAKTAKNVFGQAIVATRVGTFTASGTDTTAPNAVKESPATSTGVAITTPIRIAANEPLDPTTIKVASTPSIGDKPNVIYIGKTGKYLDFYYVYEIVPATALAVNTDYVLTVSGGKDLAGNLLPSTSINFKTEATSSGVTGTGVTADAQTAVKGVLGKWAQAMNDQNISILTSYMAGDFYWTNDPNNSSSEDLNHDGRLDLQEFTAMLNNWFGQLKNCGSTVTAAVDTANTNVSGGIAVTGNTAQIAFTLTVTSTNTANAKCAEGPNNTLYAEMQNINGAWIMTRGSDLPLQAVTIGLTKLVTSAPVNGAQLAEPTAAMPAMPDFKWTAGTWDNAGTATAFASYAVILIDNKSQWGETGWVGIIDGSALAAGSAATVRFTPTTGLTGNLLVLPSGKGFGFKNPIAEIVAGGDYTWAVLGFKTKTQNDFKLGLADPLKYLGGSSPASSFTIAGVYKELKITVQDSLTGVYATYNNWMNGYDVGIASNVTLSITTPSVATTASVNVNGYTSQQLSGPFTNGVATVTTTTLSNGNNWVEVCDNYVPGTSGPGYCAGMSKQFNISTTGGALPKIKITSVSGKTCTSAAATLTGPNSWNNYSSTDVCKVDISGTVDATITGPLNIQVGNNMDNGQYRGTTTLSGTGFTATGIQVFKGENWIQVSDQNWTNHYQINVTTGTGSTYTPPISFTTTTPATGSSTLWDATLDVGSSPTISVTVTMLNFSLPTCTANCSGFSQTDAYGNLVVGGPITSSPLPGTFNLIQGWNYFSVHDSAGNNFNVKVYTTGGVAPASQPNKITAVTNPVGTALTQNAGTYDAGIAPNNCQVKITGTTSSTGSMSVYLYNYNATSGTSVSEYLSVPVTSGAYTITQNVYAGTNTIDVYDSMWNWQGVTVNSTCTAPPVALTATVPAGGGATWDAAAYQWNAGAGNAVTVSGTAKSGSTVTISVSAGTAYNTLSTPATGTYSLANVPIYNGYNYISVTDGANWSYLTVYTTGGSAYVAPFKINSVTATAGDPGSITATDTTGYSYSGSASSVTISGTAAAAGTVNWYGGGASGSFAVSVGTFTVTVPLLNGSNYIDLYGPNGNWAGVYINTTGGVVPVQYVTMTYPLHNATVSGSVNVTATVDLTKFTPAATNVWAYVYDYVLFKSTTYTSDSASIAACPTCGYLSLTYTTSATTGTVSFSVPVTAGNTTSIEVSAGDASYMYHGNGIYVNNSLGYTSYNYKPGSNKASADQARAKAHQAEFLKKMMRR